MRGVIMKRSLLSFIIMCVALLTLPLAAQDTTKIEPEKKASPQYKNVDVEVVYPWGEKEAQTNVDAQVTYKNKKPHCIIIYKGVRKDCDIFIRGGVVVKIYDHQSRKLLKTFKG
ncbi:MAG: hypothetical protein D6732_28495 [Methanobacteriota archaeon]|nr:MAG: hypothetical protein D6732_28495 [Euryarchaeota archaeon]